MLELILLGGFAAYNMATTHSDSHDAVQGDRKINCYDIWQQITTGPGPQSIADGQSAASRLKGVYSERMNTIDELAKDMDAAWTGGGAEAAQQAGAHPLKVWMTDSGTKLGESDKYLGDQHTAFTTVHTSVQEVPKDPPKNNLLNAITPWTTDTDRAIRDYNTKGQANVNAFNTYYKASNDNGQKMPTYSALDGQKETVDVSGDQDGKGKGKDKNGNDTGNPGGPDNSYPPGPGQPGFKPGSVPGIGNPNVPGGNFTPPKIPGSDFTPPKVPTGEFTPPNIPGTGGYPPPKWDDGTHSSGYTPPKIPGGDFPSTGGFGPGGGDFSIPGGGGGGFGPGSGAPAGGVGGFGPGAGGFGPGGSSGAAVPGGAGGAGRGGVGGGMGAGGAGAGAGGAGAGRGATGMGGMGGMGHGAKGKGGGDEERTSKYLLGDDPNEIFGSDELTAPPVIGE